MELVHIDLSSEYAWRLPQLQGRSEFGAVPAAIDRSRKHRSRSTWGLVSRSIGSISNLVSGICLSRDFEQVKVLGNPTKVRCFIWYLLRAQILTITTCAGRQPNHIKHIMSGLGNLLKGTSHLLLSSPGDPRGVRCSQVSVRIFPHDFGFLSVDRNQRQGPTGA